MVKDSFWKKALNNLVEAGPTLEFPSSESTRSGTPLNHQVYRILFKDQDDWQCSIIGPRSILRMRVEREEVPMCDICFESKAQRHRLFDKWAGKLLADSSVKKFYKQIGNSQSPSSSQVDF